MKCGLCPQNKLSRVHYMLDGIARILDIIAWPLVVVFSVLILRAPLTALIPLLKKLKYKGLELEFERELEALAKESSESVKKLKQNPEAQEENISLVEDSQDIPPRDMIMESWIALQATALSTAKNYKLLEPGRPINAFSIVKILHDYDVISKDDYNNINKLRRLRNQAVHEADFAISKEEAAKFMKIAREQSGIIASNAWQKYGGCSN